MAILIPPTEDTQVIRRAKSSLGKAGKWHFVRNNQQRKVLCGESIYSFYKVEYSTLKKVRAAGICPACWPFEKRDIAAADRQISLFRSEAKPELRALDGFLN
jgi:hypothetical protein